MIGESHQAPGLISLLRRLLATAAGALQNRAELVAVEWQEEKARLTEVLLWSMIFVFFGCMGVLLVTAIVIFLFPDNLRVYVAAGFAVVYLAAAVAAWLGLKSLLEREPFSETVDQVRKDRAWLEGLK